MSKKSATSKRNLEVANGGGVVEDLTPARAEILAYLQQGLSIAQIADRRDCSPQYVRKVRSKLEDMGLYSRKVAHMVAKGGYTPQPPQPRPQPQGMENNSVKRVHADRFEFGIISSGPRFKPGLAQHLDDGTWVQCHDKKLLVYCARGRDFSGPSLPDAVQAAIGYWMRVFRKVENDLDVKILKPRKAFRLVYREVAKPGAAEAKAVLKKAGHVRVYSDRDGKLRLSFDRSTGAEREVHHKETHFEDDEAADHHFNAILSYGPDGATLPQLAQLHADCMIMFQSQIRTVNMLVDQMRSQFPESPLFDDEEADYFG